MASKVALAKKAAAERTELVDRLERIEVLLENLLQAINKPKPPRRSPKKENES